MESEVGFLSIGLANHLIEETDMEKITRSNPTEWMNLLWDVIWDYEDCKYMAGDVKNTVAFEQLMDEVKTVMAWIEEDLGIERNPEDQAD